METQRALEIIQSLADGNDPQSGERLPPNSVFNQGDTVRALFLALEALEKLQLRKTRELERPPNTGVPWSVEEERLLLERFNAKVDVKEIADQFQRSPGAIFSRLGKLGVTQLPEGIPRSFTPQDPQSVDLNEKEPPY